MAYMVNENTKDKILTILKQNSDYITGEKISSGLSISRVAVWKNINSLINIGYPVITSKKGYLLDDNYDFIYPYEFTGNSPYFYTESAVSTMNLPEKAVKNNSEIIAAAEIQSEGKGRYNRKWFSEKGGLYFTIFLKNMNIPVSLLNFLPLYTAKITVQSILKVYNIQTVIKWPNDIYYDNKKVAGILINSGCQGTIITEIAAGIGININNSLNFPGTISLSKIKNTQLKRNLLLNEIYKSFMHEIHSFNKKNIMTFYDDNSYLKNRCIEAIDDNNIKFTGTTGSLDDYGGLLIKQNNSQIIPIYSCNTLNIIS
ncbi:MAG: biotin--[acetyl-CoA-carboxylase] ligase [Spirochaetes bacterium]|nr:biotin--[acetyl-CoA-carboxylase] ligase [Spirochaetota bacterium]